MSASVILSALPKVEEGGEGGGGRGEGGREEEGVVFSSHASDVQGEHRCSSLTPRRGSKSMFYVAIFANL